VGLYLYDRNKGQEGKEPIWYIGGWTSGKKQRPTGLVGADKEALARTLLEQEKAAVTISVAVTGRDAPHTLTTFVPIWLDELVADDPDHVSAKDYAAIMRIHVLPVIGHLRLTAITVESLKTVLRHIKRTVKAERTRRRIWRVLVQVLIAAETHDPPLIPASPHRRVKDHLIPQNEDSDPEWRNLAVFTEEEAGVLVFDERVRPDRRIYYALLYFLGTRQGEASALRLRAWTRGKPGDEALGEMLVAWSYNSELRLLKKTKTGITRIVPVHPLLAELLHEWLRPGGGWARMFGRNPGPDDFIAPSTQKQTRPRHRSAVYAGWNTDLAAVGLRHRRMHDTRATYIALLIDHGASETLVDFTTHGVPGGSSSKAFQVYKRRPGWLRLCGEIMKLPIARPTLPAEVLPLRKIAGLEASNLQDTYAAREPEQSSVVRPTTTSSPCSELPMGKQGTGGAPMGNPEVPQRSRAALSRPAEEKERHLCGFVSAVSGALTALEKGDKVRAIAILRKALSKGG
jgi:integrase